MVDPSNSSQENQRTSPVDQPVKPLEAQYQGKRYLAVHLQNGRVVETTDRRLASTLKEIQKFVQIKGDDLTDDQIKILKTHLKERKNQLHENCRSSNYFRRQIERIKSFFIMPMIDETISNLPVTHDDKVTVKKIEKNEETLSHFIHKFSAALFSKLNLQEGEAKAHSDTALISGVLHDLILKKIESGSKTLTKEEIVEEFRRQNRKEEWIDRDLWSQLGNTSDVKNAPEYDELNRAYHYNLWGADEEKMITLVRFNDEELPFILETLKKILDHPSFQKGLKNFLGGN